MELESQTCAPIKSLSESHSLFKVYGFIYLSALHGLPSARNVSLLWREQVLWQAGQQELTAAAAEDANEIVQWMSLLEDSQDEVAELTSLPALQGLLERMESQAGRVVANEYGGYGAMDEMGRNKLRQVCQDFHKRCARVSQDDEVAALHWRIQALATARQQTDPETPDGTRGVDIGGKKALRLTAVVQDGDDILQGVCSETDALRIKPDEVDGTCDGCCTESVHCWYHFTRDAAGHTIPVLGLCSACYRKGTPREILGLSLWQLRGLFEKSAREPLDS